MTVLLLWLQLAMAQGPAGCSTDDRRHLAEARAAVMRGDAGDVKGRLDHFATSTCGAGRLAELAWRGWLQARALAPLGGAVDHLGPVRATLGAIAELGSDDMAPLALEREYAETAVRAAIAAAQDERPEMELLLTHARDLAERMQQRGRRAEWPLPFNVLAGELWFEVDRFQDAVAAYERAVSVEATARALVGLARAYARLDRLTAACRTYARAGEMASALRALAARDLARCR